MCEVQCIIERFHRSACAHFERLTYEALSTTRFEKSKVTRYLNKSRRQHLDRIVSHRAEDDTLVQVCNKLKSVILRRKLSHQMRKARKSLMLKSKVDRVANSTTEDEYLGDSSELSSGSVHITPVDQVKHK